ncbi:MAG: radical SAM-associated putative lipoprotein [Bacteroidetes bacterium]|nr:radical SAM-associated putative lipoprotein [Bacteroidota bacterium]
MKKLILTTANKAILLLLIFLGFACDSDDDFNGNVEYGSFSADFKATGTIVDKSTLNRLSGIQVAMGGDTVYSGQNGEYVITVRNSPNIQKYDISFVDTNMIYPPKDTVLDFSDEMFENGDEWYKGIKTMQVDIKLEPNEFPN